MSPRIKKGYADCNAGQVFYRNHGSGPVVVLIHWTPLSSRMYLPLIEHLADAGFCVIAPDLLGYGRSDPRPEQWTMEDYGGTIIQTLDQLNVDRFSIVGGHNGASVALETTLLAPDRVNAVVLDGCPILTDELRAIFKDMAAQSTPSVSPDGAHKSLPFERAIAIMEEYTGNFEVTDNNLPLIYEIMIDYLETRFVSSGPIAGAYDITTRLPQLKIPAMVMAATDDICGPFFETVCGLLSGCEQHLFQGGHPLHLEGQTPAYFEIIEPFLRKHVGA